MMRHFISSGSILLFTIVCAASLHAFDIGGAVQRTTERTAKGAARGAVQNEYNKKLQENDCTYPDATSLEPKCDVDKIIDDLTALHTTAESSGFANDVDVIIKAYGPEWDIARQRAESLRDKVRVRVDWWDYSVDYSKSQKNEVVFQVRIR